ncbi:hypothetical protein COL36_27930 [Bacillus wiedmannii]|nr:hypothetical protein COL36_27930 [Bacillus wiedmannii]PHF07796.1 hypothetical protein COF84_29110 [Bacillus wiedmannii]
MKKGPVVSNRTFPKMAKTNCSAGSPRGKGERLGTSLNEFWLSPIYIIDGILSFIQSITLNV